jgi:hypothetical protein
MANFDRYSMFKSDGKVSIVPFVSIRKKNSDKQVVFNKNTMRLDKLSYEYYETPDFAWLIMQANPEYGSIENFIPDGVVLRIPYPLEETINAYLDDITTYNKMYK